MYTRTIKNNAAKFAALLAVLLPAVFGNAQKLTVSANFGKAVALGAFSFSDETAGASGFNTTTFYGGTVALGANIEYRLNKRFTMGVAPQFIYDRAKMQIIATSNNTPVSSIKVVHAYQTMVIPYCIGYTVDLFKGKLPINIIGGLSYTRYNLSGITAEGESGAGFTGPSGAAFTDSSSFDATNTLGFVLGIDTYPIKGFSKLGFYIRYYGSFGSAAFDTKNKVDGFRTQFITGSTTRTFYQGFNYRPSNLVIGLMYRFNLIK